MTRRRWFCWGRRRRYRGPWGIRSGRRDAGRRGELAGVVDVLDRFLEWWGDAAGDGATPVRCRRGPSSSILCKIGRTDHIRRCAWSKGRWGVPNLAAASPYSTGFRATTAADVADSGEESRRSCVPSGSGKRGGRERRSGGLSRRKRGKFLLPESTGIKRGTKQCSRCPRAKLPAGGWRHPTGGSHLSAGERE
jgi:hypothetical protein